MDINFENTRDENFERACNLCNMAHSRDAIFQYLKNGNLPERQYAALMVDSIQSQEEAEIFINNLTGCDGKIREAVAFKLTELIPQYVEYFYSYPEIMSNATIDINANISRMVIDCLKYFESDIFIKEYLKYIFKILDEAIVTYDGFIFRDKKYTINKQLFKIYWCLEGLSIFYPHADQNKLKEVLDYCVKIPEYTIREKVAQILNNDLPEGFDSIKAVLHSDSNYYVQRQLKC